jgi:hypothetical protein
MVKAVRLGKEQLHLAMLWLMSYTFLLRLPSEARELRSGGVSGRALHACVQCQALMACKGSPDDPALAKMQTLVWKEGNEVCIRILRRKNKPQGSGVIRRECTCKGCVDTCAVHTLWTRFFEKLATGHQPWALISPNEARARLRAVLDRLGVPDVNLYGTHDFRRGHAEVRV